MRICYALLFDDEQTTEPRSFLDRTRLLKKLPRQMTTYGHQVDVVIQFPREVQFVVDGVHYRFAKTGFLASQAGRIAGRLLERDPAFLKAAFRTVATIRRLKPDVIHFHGTNLHVNLLLLLVLGRDAPPLVLHYHGGYPSNNRLVRAVQRFNFRRADRLLFTTAAHARPFVDAGILDDGLQRVTRFMEVSTTFEPQSTSAARGETGMVGNPVFLSTARLHPLKDPVTVVRGFERILRQRPNAHLYMYYLTDELLPEVTSFVAAHPGLKEHVHLRGRARFEQMEAIYNSADFLLQASRREFSGYAVLEAMACGTVPVVTDIPSFRRMTADGRCGLLFPREDYKALADEVLALSRTDLRQQKQQVRRRFETTFSYEVLAQRLNQLYYELTAREKKIDLV